MPSLAFTRPPSDRFSRALCATPPDPPIDLATARADHAAYQDALTRAGVAVIAISGSSDLPDCCFVEDTAVVAGGVALITRPGAPSRRAETTAVADALAAHIEVATMAEPATLDGGDCMRVGSRIYVGRSARTNAAGIARLAEVFEPRGLRVIPVELPAQVLHLKCVCAPLDDDRITLAHATISPAAFEGVEVVTVPAAEAYAANLVAISGTVLVAAGFPRTHDLLASAGFVVIPLATGEFRKADGALTCLSILL